MCILDEVDHVYYVNGMRYKYSASDVVHAFFPQFDKELAHRLIRVSGQSLRNLKCSVYWLYMYLILIEGLGGQDKMFGVRVEEVSNAADKELANETDLTDWNLREAHDLLIGMINAKVVSKPSGRACYFLARCAGCIGEQVQVLWVNLASWRL